MRGKKIAQHVRNDRNILLTYLPTNLLTCKRVAFTLAEMMVVLLIMTIVLAAAAPVMTTRHSRDNSQPWKWLSTGSPHAYFGHIPAQVAMIGQNNAPDAEEQQAKLIINSQLPDHILFKNGNDILAKLHFANGGMSLGTLADGTDLGSGAIAIGKETNLSGGKNSILVGNDSTINVANSKASAILIGNSLAAESTYNAETHQIAIGTGTTASTTGWVNSIAIGYNANAIGGYTTGTSIAIGQDITANGQSIAIGRNITTNGGSYAIGNINGTVNGIAIGHSLEDTNGLVVGKGVKTSGGSVYDVVIGNANQVTSSNGDLPAVNVGSGAYTSGSGATAVGSFATAGIYNTAIGYSARAGYIDTSNYKYKIPTGSNADGTVSWSNTAIGSGVVAYGGGAVAVGGKAIAGSAIAIKGTAEVLASIAIGSSAHTYEEAIYGIAVGHRTHTTGKYGLSIGTMAQTAADSAIAIGAGNILQFSARAYGAKAIAIGTYSVAGKPENLGSHDSLTTPASDAGVGQVSIGSNSQALGNLGTALGSSTRANGEYSVAIGYNAQTPITSAIALGYDAQATAKNTIAIGAKNTSNTTKESTVASGDYGIAIGTGSAASGNHSVALGLHAKAKHLNSIAIGAKAETTDTNEIVLGSFGNKETVRMYGNLYVAGSQVVPSDRRLKNVGKEFTSGLDKIRELKVFNYTYKDDKTKTPRVGVIAQDLQKVFPSAVKKDSKGFLSIRMEDMFYAVINAIKELDAKVTTLFSAVKEVKTENEQLKKRCNDLEKRLEALEQKIK